LQTVRHCSNTYASSWVATTMTRIGRRKLFTYFGAIW